MNVEATLHLRGTISGPATSRYDQTSIRNDSGIESLAHLLASLSALFPSVLTTVRGKRRCPEEA